ncbi:MAG TPA: GNAT family N-acetyltransferase [Kofleriaceae bacterium]|nr:GNAT family N-acetyltransferase [Kofleriaceae bacterium]
MITYRRGSPADSRTLFAIFEAAIDDLGARMQANGNSTAGDPEAWERRRPLYEHLAQTAEHLWIAEDDGRPIGYARSILRDGVRELTELFVLPDLQANGVGRELLERAFPADGARHRTLLATLDMRAVARYLRSGLDGRLPIFSASRAPEPVAVASDLQAEPLVTDPATLARLGEIDRELLGYRRDVDHRWFAQQRRGQVYRRGADIVAYGYPPFVVGWGGPYAALDPADLPRLLADAESEAHRAGHHEISFDVALINRAALDHLLGRGYRLQSFPMILFSDAELGRLDRYVFFSPAFLA